MNPELIERIYECAFLPEKWPEVLAQFAKIADARLGWLMVVGEESDQCVASNEAGLKVLEPMVVSRAPSCSPRFARLCAAAHPGFLREIDIYANDEFKTEPFYREHIYPYGLGWAAATTFVLPTRELLLVSMERLYDRGPVEPAIVRQLDVYAPERKSLNEATETVGCAGAKIRHLSSPLLFLARAGDEAGGALFSGPACSPD